MGAAVTGMKNCALEVGKVLPWVLTVLKRFWFCFLQVETFQREESKQWHRGARDQGMLPECDLGPHGPGSSRRWTWGVDRVCIPKQQ